MVLMGVRGAVASVLVPEVSAGFVGGMRVVPVLAGGGSVLDAVGCRLVTVTVIFSVPPFPACWLVWGLTGLWLVVGVPDGAASVELFVVPTLPRPPCCVAVAPVPLRSTPGAFDVCAVGAVVDTVRPPLVVVVAAAGSRVLGGVGPARAGVVVSGWGLGAPEMVLEAAGWLLGVMVAVGWVGAVLLGGLVVAVTVAPGVGAMVDGA